MKLLSPVATQLMKASVVEHFVLADLGGVVRGTTLPFTASINGATYNAETAIVGVDPPRISRTVDREVYRIKLADPGMSFRQYVETGLTGAPVTVYVGCYNNTGEDIVCTDGSVVHDGHPVLCTTDMLMAYKGRIDAVGYEFDPDGEAHTLSIECASPMADLDMARVVMTSKESQRMWDSSDTAFDAIFDGSAETILKWGKA